MKKVISKKWLEILKSSKSMYLAENLAKAKKSDILILSSIPTPMKILKMPSSKTEGQIKVNTWSFWGYSGISCMTNLKVNYNNAIINHIGVSVLAYAA